MIDSKALSQYQNFLIVLSALAFSLCLVPDRTSDYRGALSEVTFLNGLSPNSYGTFIQSKAKAALESHSVEKLQDALAKKYGLRSGPGTPNVGWWTIMIKMDQPPLFAQQFRAFLVVKNDNTSLSEMLLYLDRNPAIQVVYPDYKTVQQTAEHFISQACATGCTQLPVGSYFQIDMTDAMTDWFDAKPKASVAYDVTTPAKQGALQAMDQMTPSTIETLKDGHFTDWLSAEAKRSGAPDSVVGLPYLHKLVGELGAMKVTAAGDYLRQKLYSSDSDLEIAGIKFPKTAVVAVLETALIGCICFVLAITSEPNLSGLRNDDLSWIGFNTNLFARMTTIFSIVLAPCCALIWLLIRYPATSRFVGAMFWFGLVVLMLTSFLALWHISRLRGTAKVAVAAADEATFAVQDYSS